MRDINKLADIMHDNPNNLVYCWKLQRKDGHVFRFTEATHNVFFQKEEYLAETGFRSSAIQEDCNFKIDNLDIDGILDSKFIIAEDIMLGLYDKAVVEIFMINPSNQTDRVFLKRGYIGNIKLVGNDRFVAEINGFLQSAEQHTTQRYSLTCRASLGDSKCKLDLSQYTFHGNITKLIDNKTFQDINSNQEDGYFDYGTILFETKNNGIIRNNIKFFINKTFELAKPCNFVLLENMDYIATIGCDKTCTSCSKKFNNIVNFRGEPHIPGIEKLYNRNN